MTNGLKRNNRFNDRLYAPYACDPQKTRGRLFEESEGSIRTVFQRDRDRIIHSTAFRRLSHKTQVFITHSKDHYRTRLTHTLEVAQIARTLARFLGCNEDLVEAIALAHDLGHPPFGHIGEDMLNQKMKAWGGFNHNVQSFRIVTQLERRYIDFDGLNLTWECLEGLLKHNGPLLDSKGHALQEKLLQESMSLSSSFDPFPSCFSSLEAQCAAIADDIAYNAHDMDDGLRAGLLTLEMIEEVTAPFCPSFSKELRSGGNLMRLCYEVTRHQIALMVEDVVQETLRRLEDVNPRNVEDVRNAGKILVGFSNRMEEHAQKLKKFLSRNIYQNPSLIPLKDEMRRVISDLFDVYFQTPHEMPDPWRFSASLNYDPFKARHIADFLSGMTDPYALQEYHRFFQRIPFCIRSHLSINF